MRNTKNVIKQRITDVFPVVADADENIYRVAYAGGDILWVRPVGPHANGETPVQVIASIEPRTVITPNSIGHVWILSTQYDEVEYENRGDAALALSNYMEDFVENGILCEGLN